MPKISVIVPVYNKEKYLNRCIESILGQTFVDFELILIDDGSTDNSGKICDEYAESDLRVVVIHKENAGVCSARNDGINKAVGDYIVFIDGDDLIHNRYLELLYTYRNYDLVICKILYFNNENEIDFLAEINSSQEFDKTDYPKLYADPNTYADYSVLSQCCKLFNLKKIKDNVVFFPLQYNWGEDSIFVSEYLKYTNKILLIDYYGYYYQHNQNYSLSSMIREDIIDQVTDARLKCLQNIQYSIKYNNNELEHFFYDNIKDNTSFFVRKVFTNNKLSIINRIRLLKKFKRNSFVKETFKEPEQYYSRIISISLRLKVSFLQILCYDFLMFLKRTKKST